MSNYLVSVGGSGNTFLSNFFGTWRVLKRVGVNQHQRDPNGKVEGDKLLYLFADPFNVFLSYDRRGFFRNNSHCQNIGAEYLTTQLDQKHRSLEDVLNLETDPFKLAEHFDGYWNFKDRPYDIMFARYETLGKTIPQICEFYGGEADPTKLLVKERNSDWTQQPKEIQEKLEKMYGEYRERLMTLDDIIINP